MGKNICSLANAIKQMRNLDERLKLLEEKAAKKNNNGHDSDHIDDDEQMMPEIKARVCNGNILMKILCGKRKGVLVKLLRELDTLNLDVVSANVAPFGSLVLDITITAQMEKEFCVTVKDVVIALRSSLQPGF